MSQCGLAGAGRTPEDDRAGAGRAACICPGRQLAQRRALAQQVLLAHYIVKCPGPHADGKGAAGHGVSRGAGSAAAGGSLAGSAVGSVRRVAVVVIALPRAKEIIHIDRLLIDW